MGSMVKLNATVDIQTDVLRRTREWLRGAPERVSAHRAHVGILENDGGEEKKDYHGKPTSMTVAQVALLQEMNGRSWLRTWFDQNRDRLGQGMTAAMRAEYQGDKDAARLQAHEWSVELRAWIEKQEGGLKALSAFTVTEKQKAGLSSPDVPLLATGQLVESIKAMLDGSPA